jgi:hypothetical protein
LPAALAGIVWFCTRAVAAFRRAMGWNDAAAKRT